MTDTSHLRNELATRAEQTAAVEQTNGDRPTIAQLIDRQRSEIARALPKHMDADRLARIATTTIKTTPALLECTASSLLGALMLSAQTGLEPGPLGHAYLVPRRIKGVMECQWLLGYKGIIELARRSGQIVSIEAREVCERDQFEFAYGLEERLVHEPYMGGERGPIVAFWGLAKFTDGGHYFLVMSKADVDKAKERSDAGKKGFGPWVTDYAAMGRKTVIRRMMPFLPLSTEQATILTHDESVNTRVAPDLAAEPASASWVEAESWEPAGEVGTGGSSGPDEGDPDGEDEPTEVDPPLVPTAASDDAAASPPLAPVEEDNPDPMTDPQSKALHALLRSKRGVAGPNRHPVVSELLGRKVTSLKQVTRSEAGNLIEILQEEAELETTS